MKDDKVHLHKTNGVKIAVPMSKTSYQDREYIEHVMKSSKTLEISTHGNENHMADVVETTREDTNEVRSEYPASSSSTAELDGDVLLINCGESMYPIFFPANSIGDGLILVGDIRTRAATRLDVIRSDLGNC